MIVVGQDFVKDGDPVEAVLGGRGRRQARNRRHEADRRLSPISHARLTLAVLVFLLVAGRARLHQRSRRRPNPDVTIPIIYVQLSAARHLAGGRRAPAAAADGDGAEVGRQRQGDALGRPSRAAATCCSSSRPGSIPTWRSQDVRAKVDDAKRDLPADADEPERARGQSQPLPGRRRRRCPATSPNARSATIARAGAGRASSRCRACSRPTCRARATRSSRSSPSRCC